MINLPAAAIRPDPGAKSLHGLTLLELAKRIERGEVSPSEATAATLGRIIAVDGDLRSFAHVMAEDAIAEARKADAEIAAGRYRGPLHGVPIGVKDLLWTKNAPTAGGTAIHKDFRPVEDATVVKRLRDAGANIIGKLQMTEGAYSDHHFSIAPPVNPWNAAYWPGISSSGPGVAVAAGLCFGAIASDTGGSIRWPSAANGLTGLKPTWGRVSRHGVSELAASLDHIGPIARSAADAGVILDVIAGPDPADPTALHAPSIETESSDGVAGVRIGIDPLWNETGVDAATVRVVSEAVATFRDLGAEIVELAAPDIDDAVADWPLNCAVEAAVAHETTYPARKSEYGPVLASVIEAGRLASGLDYQRVLLRRMSLRGALSALFGKIDLLLTPVHPFAPLTLSDIRTLGEQPELVAKLQRFTCPFNMSGSPTITLPGGSDDVGMPIGFQLVGDHLSERLLVKAGVAFQRSTRWHERRPKVDQQSFG